MRLPSYLSTGSRNTCREFKNIVHENYFSLNAKDQPAQIYSIPSHTLPCISEYIFAFLACQDGYFPGGYTVQWVLRGCCLTCSFLTGVLCAATAENCSSAVWCSSLGCCCCGCCGCCCWSCGWVSAAPSWAGLSSWSCSLSLDSESDPDSVVMVGYSARQGEQSCWVQSHSCEFVS